MVVFAGDMNGHVGSSNVGYDVTHGGFGYGSRNADGSKILEFADGLNLVICNTLFTKQEAKLVTYVAVQLITLWFGRRTKPRFEMSRLLRVRNDIASCIVSKHGGGTRRLLKQLGIRR